eukprot:scaffold1641_cov24-Tisochrysis_lutea.AAC.1
MMRTLRLCEHSTLAGMQVRRMDAVLPNKCAFSKRAPLATLPTYVNAHTYTHSHKNIEGSPTWWTSSSASSAARPPEFHMQARVVGEHDAMPTSMGTTKPRTQVQRCNASTAAASSGASCRTHQQHVCVYV